MANEVGARAVPGATPPAAVGVKAGAIGLPEALAGLGTSAVVGLAGGAVGAVVEGRVPTLADAMVDAGACGAPICVGEIPVLVGFGRPCPPSAAVLSADAAEAAGKVPLEAPA